MTNNRMGRVIVKDRHLYPKFYMTPAGKKCRARLFKATLKTNNKLGKRLQWENCANGYGMKAVK